MSKEIKNWHQITKAELGIYMRIRQASAKALIEVTRMRLQLKRERGSSPAVQIPCERCEATILVLPLESIDTKGIRSWSRILDLAVNTWNDSEDARTCPQCSHVHIVIPPVASFKALAAAAQKGKLEEFSLEE